MKTNNLYFYIEHCNHKESFRDEFYFSRLFKKIEGISPKEFYNKNVHEN